MYVSDEHNQIMIVSNVVEFPNRFCHINAHGRIGLSHNQNIFVYKVQNSLTFIISKLQPRLEKRLLLVFITGFVAFATVIVPSFVRWMWRWRLPISTLLLLLLPRLPLLHFFFVC